MLIVRRYQGIIENRKSEPIHLEQALQTDTPASLDSHSSLTANGMH